MAEGGEGVIIIISLHLPLPKLKDGHDRDNIKFWNILVIAVPSKFDKSDSNSIIENMRSQAKKIAQRIGHLEQSERWESFLEGLGRTHRHLKPDATVDLPRLFQKFKEQTEKFLEKKIDYSQYARTVSSIMRPLGETMMMYDAFTHIPGMPDKKASLEAYRAYDQAPSEKNLITALKTLVEYGKKIGIDYSNENIDFVAQGNQLIGTGALLEPSVHIMEAASAMIARQ